MWEVLQTCWLEEIGTVLQHDAALPVNVTGAVARLHVSVC